MGTDNQQSMFNSFTSLTSKVQLCQFLGITTTRLNFLLYGLPCERRYKTHAIKKRNGGERRIREPIPPLKKIQKIIAGELAKQYRPRQHVYGYTKNKNIVQKARVHVAQKWVARVDLKDFFPSVNFGRVKGLFRGHPFDFNHEIATLLAQLVMDGNELPQGAPTSPIISNFICRSLDYELKRMAKAHRCFYTRYADDLVFSTSQKRLSPQVCSPLAADGISVQAVVGDGLRAVVERQGFVVNDAKTRIFSKSSRQQVTGITVNEKVNVSREYIRGLRAVLHAWRKHGEEAAASWFFANHYKRNRPHWKSQPADFREVIRGRMTFVRFVKGGDDTTYLTLAKKLAQLDDGFQLDAAEQLQAMSPRLMVYTEGVTDTIHLRHALSRMKGDGRYVDLNVDWADHSDRPRGEGKLWQNCVNDSRREEFRHQIQVYLFDRDSDFAKKAEDKYGKLKHHGNNVYSLVLPIPEHRHGRQQVCIEHLYRDEFLWQKDAQGRRLFPREDFDLDGHHIGGLEVLYRHPKAGTLIVDSDVVGYGGLRGKPVVMSKKQFADAVDLRVEPFHAPSFAGFEAIFDTLSELSRSLGGGHRPEASDLL
ncbi:reverse transcriptase domain-containing protein [Caballeronia sp. BCC1704]|uniref:reverse transcriptase domain-containing protein n=1 Tax=Caballeronia sp. BCC1704 TaxID=2676300 RepID=UPI00158D4298|nr:reverse transcriptase domain-containing protein [Caballeronia sp. BCC1704]